MIDTFHQIQALVADDLSAVNACIKENLHSHVPFIETLSSHIIESGGKRLRPLIVLLGAKAFQYEGREHIPLASAMEYFHTATLLHDDVIDESSMRRGAETANEIWGSKRAVLVGDYMFTRSFQLMLKAENVAVLKVLADASNAITQGEVLQLVNSESVDITEQDYMQVIRDKTSVLFAAAAKLGAILTSQDDQIIFAMDRYGLHLGNAFQIVDDILDYSASSQSFGKNLGNDLSEGKLTLPMIYTLALTKKDNQLFIKDVFRRRDISALTDIISIIHSTDAIEQCIKRANEEVKFALAHLKKIPQSIYRDSLENLSTYAVDRQF